MPCGQWTVGLSLHSGQADDGLLSLSLNLHMPMLYSSQHTVQTDDRMSSCHGPTTHMDNKPDLLRVGLGSLGPVAHSM
jgi:hypothetical protein